MKKNKYVRNGTDVKILVINAGSSSLKYQLIDMTDESVIAKGNIERIGVDGIITHKVADGRSVKENKPFATHKDAFEELVARLTTGELAVLSDIHEIAAIGHRVLHGSEKYKKTTLITDEVIYDIGVTFKDLGPLHNPPQAVAMQACRDVFGPEVPMAAVFDTSFHQTMPDKAYIFGIPYEYYEKYHIRRYGFHGTSHRFVSARVAELMGRPIEELKIISCHLGNGSSITAVDKGKSIDTTMGFTPLDGVIMGTRSGGIDPSVVTYIMDKEGLTPAEMNNLLNKKSGFIGLSGKSTDSRDIVDLSLAGDYRAALTAHALRYQIKKYIGAYTAAMNGVDAIAFTGGIGENSLHLRSEVCEDMDYLGIKIDEELNVKYDRQEHDISAPDARVKTFIIKTNEELLIARDTKELVEAL